MNYVQVDPGNPHNDQALAQCREDLAQHLDAIRGIFEQGLEQGAPLSALMAVIVAGLLQNETETRERLASLLALSIVKNLAEDRKFLSDGLSKYINDLAAGR